MRINILIFIFTGVLSISFSAYGFEKDIYENDDSKEIATRVDAVDSENQQHNFHQKADQDWFKFYARKDYPYSIEVIKQEKNANTVIEVYNQKGEMISSVNDAIAGEGEYELLELSFDQEGIYYFLIRQFDADIYGQNTGYQVRLYHPFQPLTGQIITHVSDAITGQAIQNPSVKSSSPDRALYLGSIRGNVKMNHSSGNYHLTFMADKYQPFTTDEIEVNEGKITFLAPIKLYPIESSSPPLVQIKEHKGIYSINIPQLFINEQTSNMKAVLSIVPSEQVIDKVIFSVTELSTLDSHIKDENYPFIIPNTTILYIPLLQLDNQNITKVELQLVPNKNAIQFELISYKI